MNRIKLSEHNKAISLLWSVLNETRSICLDGMEKTTRARVGYIHLPNLGPLVTKEFLRVNERIKAIGYLLTPASNFNPSSTGYALLHLASARMPYSKVRRLCAGEFIGIRPANNTCYIEAYLVRNNTDWKLRWARHPNENRQGDAPFDLDLSVSAMQGVWYPVVLDTRALLLDEIRIIYTKPTAG